MKIQDGNKQKVVFRTRYSHFKYQVLELGLFNTLTSFQAYFNKILAKKIKVFIIMYLNNILIYTKDLSQNDVKDI